MGGDGKGGVKNDSDVSNLRGCLVLLAHVRMEKLDGAIRDSRRMMLWASRNKIYINFEPIKTEKEIIYYRSLYYNYYC